MSNLGDGPEGWDSRQILRQVSEKVRFDVRTEQQELKIRTE
jgi:hypothetical protein